MTCKIKHRKKIVCLEDDLSSVSSKSSSSEFSISIGENETENIWNHRGLKKLTKGHIVFQNVSLKYDNYPLILNNVSFEILPGEKVGVVGQKNADSNSIAIALYRLKNICDGVIMIDDMDLSSIDIVGDIFIVQKDPIIYSNTIRGIVDLSNKFSDMDIWNALEKVRLKYSMDKKNIDLDTKVNLMKLSSVKRQLLFLVQALIKKPKILIVKENEESQDPEQMNVLQEVILEQFEKETVLILANHPKSISSCDKILYLEKGEVVEEGKPSVLLKSSSSRLSHLIFNLKDIIIKRASEARNSNVYKHDKSKPIVDCKLSKSDEKSLSHNFVSDSYEVEIKNVDLGTGSRSVSDENCCEDNAVTIERCAQDIDANSQGDYFYKQDYKSSSNHVEESINTSAKKGKNLLLPNISKEKHLSANHRSSNSFMSKKSSNEVTRRINKQYFSEKRKIGFTRGNKFRASHLSDSKVLSSSGDNIKDTTHNTVLKNEKKSVKRKNNINNLKDKSYEIVNTNKTRITDKERSITSSSDQINKNYCSWEYMSKTSTISKNENYELNKIKLGRINKLPLESEKNNTTLKETTDGGSFKVKRNNISVETTPSKTYSNEISDILSKEDVINYIKKGSAPYRKEVLRLPK